MSTPPRSRGWLSALRSGDGGAGTWRRHGAWRGMHFPSEDLAVLLSRAGDVVEYPGSPLYPDVLCIQRTAKELTEDQRVRGIAPFAWCHLSWMQSTPLGSSIRLNQIPQRRSILSGVQDPVNCLGHLPAKRAVPAKTACTGGLPGVPDMWANILAARISHYFK